MLESIAPTFHDWRHVVLQIGCCYAVELVLLVTYSLDILMNVAVSSIQPMHYKGALLALSMSTIYRLILIPKVEAKPLAQVHH